MGKSSHSNGFQLDPQSLLFLPVAIHGQLWFIAANHSPDLVHKKVSGADFSRYASAGDW